MDQHSKNGSRPIPDAAISTKYLAFKLEEALAAEQLINQNLLLMGDDRKPWEVTVGSRDGSVHILRFLRIWFDLPSTVFFNAVLYLDQFLARMKVQERYLKCLTVSCFYIAASRAGINMDKHQLVTISQSKCSEKDMLRMADIVQQKLNLENSEKPTCPADFLDIFVEILAVVNAMFDEPILFLTKMLNKEMLLTRLEVLMTDKSCGFYRPSMMALALVQIEIERHMNMSLLEQSASFLHALVHLFKVIGEIQNTCKITGNDMTECQNYVTRTLQEYDNQEKAKHSQNLMWRFSSSTYALCNKYRTNRHSHYMLDTIEEQLPVTYH